MSEQAPAVAQPVVQAFTVTAELPLTKSPGRTILRTSDLSHWKLDYERAKPVNIGKAGLQNLGMSSMAEIEARYPESQILLIMRAVNRVMSHTRPVYQREGFLCVHRGLLFSNGFQRALTFKVEVFNAYNEVINHLNSLSGLAGTRPVSAAVVERVLQNLLHPLTTLLMNMTTLRWSVDDARKARSLNL